ncbi:MAG: molecular chaperone TorD family protein [Coriobacteriales bacterium]|jgi:TorA maturation chaperone TorD|nr:molecular chaperone TorD family protein [Coriobacteriales bacterium]
MNFNLADDGLFNPDSEENVTRQDYQVSKKRDCQTWANQANQARAYQVLCEFCSTMLYDDLALERIQQLCENAQLLLKPPFSTIATEESAALFAYLNDATETDSQKRSDTIVNAASATVEASVSATASADPLLTAAASSVSATASVASATSIANMAIMANSKKSSNDRSSKIKSGIYDEVNRDCSFLFFMVGKSNTSPYESVYRTEDRTLFGPTTLEVRELFRKQGFAPALRSNQPEDHIAIEFAYLAFLFNRLATLLDNSNANLIVSDDIKNSVQSIQNDDVASTKNSVQSAQNNDGTKTDIGANTVIKNNAQASIVVKDICDFLEKHLLVFAYEYLNNLRRQAKSVFYQSVAGIAICTLDSLRMTH